MTEKKSLKIRSFKSHVQGICWDSPSATGLWGTFMKTREVVVLQDGGDTSHQSLRI